MNETGIDTRLVYGFLDAGKTSYIQDCIQNDYFYKYGKTLILCFEQGEETYDEDALAAKNAAVVYHDGAEDIGAFCLRCIESYRPDRVYVEMNAMTDGLPERFPDCMRVTYAVTWIDWATLKLYYVNFRQMLSRMIAASQQVIFRDCPSKELLAPYSQDFRLMNQRASYLRRDPMGYHEKAFDLFLPFSLDDGEIAVTEERYLPLWLDAFDHPEHYEGKTLRFTAPLELRRDEDNGPLSAGRVVMICCMADLQFMAFELEDESGGNADDANGGHIGSEHGGWVTMDAKGRVGTGAYGRRILKLQPIAVRPSPPPAALILSSRPR